MPPVEKYVFCLGRSQCQSLKGPVHKVQLFPLGIELFLNFIGQAATRGQCS